MTDETQNTPASADAVAQAPVAANTSVVEGNATVSGTINAVIQSAETAVEAAAPSIEERLAKVEAMLTNLTTAFKDDITALKADLDAEAVQVETLAEGWYAHVKKLIASKIHKVEDFLHLGNAQQ